MKPRTFATPILCFAMSVAFSVKAAVGITNPGFETGNLSGWQTDPADSWAYVARPLSGSDYEMAPALYGYGGYSGGSFAVLNPATDGASDTLSQTFDLFAGQLVTGMAGFCMQAFYFSDSGASVWIAGPGGSRALVWEAVAADVGVEAGWEQYDHIDRLWWGKGWEDWSFRAPIAGTYTLNFESHGNGRRPVVGVFDIASVSNVPVPAIPETLNTLVFTLLAFLIAAACRRRP